MQNQECSMSANTVHPSSSIQPSILSDQGDCLVCGVSLEEEIRTCTRCETPHHIDCWEYSQGCAVFGCKSSHHVVLVNPDLAKTDQVHGFNFRNFLLSLLQRGAQASVLQIAYLGALCTAVFGFILLDCILPNGSRLIPTSIPIFGTLFGIIMMIESRRISTISNLLFKQIHQPAAIEETPLKTLEAKLSEDPKNLNLMEALAYGLQSEGSLERALELYQDALSIFPREHRIRFRLARCHYAMGNQEETRKEFQTLIQIAPEGAFSEMAKRWLSKNPLPEA